MALKKITFTPGDGAHPRGVLADVTNAANEFAAVNCAIIFDAAVEGNAGIAAALQVALERYVSSGHN
jgi:hypothetical protein